MHVWACFGFTRHLNTVSWVLEKWLHRRWYDLYKTDTSLIRTLCSVPSVFVLERFDCTFLCGSHTSVLNIGFKATFVSPSCCFLLPFFKTTTLPNLHLYPREARLINLSGRRPSIARAARIRAKNISYIVEDVRPVAWQQCKQSLNYVRQREGC